MSSEPKKNDSEDDLLILVLGHAVEAGRDIQSESSAIGSLYFNMRGYVGANIPCDLHMEQLSRRLKPAICVMGGNMSTWMYRNTSYRVHKKNTPFFNTPFFDSVNMAIIIHNFEILLFCIGHINHPDKVPIHTQGFLFS